MKMNMNKITSTSMSNPLVIVVGLLLILILILSVFKSTTPHLNLGFEVNAHLGGLKGSFQIETFEDLEDFENNENFENNEDFENNEHFENYENYEDFENNEDFENYEDFEDFKSNDNGPVFIAFTIPTCGHCVKMNPEFEKLMKGYKGKTKVVKLDCSKGENRELAQREGVQGYPTIKYYPKGLNGGRPQEYDGERKYTNFVQFLNSVSGVQDKAPDNAAKF